MKDPSQILSEVAATQQEKNDDYGDSWRLIGETIELWADGDLSIDADADTLSSLGLFIRRLDKLIRAFNGEFLADELNHESLQDSHRDEAGYAGMHAALLAEQESWQFFTDDAIGIATDQSAPLETVDCSVTVGDMDSVPVTDFTIGYQPDLTTEDDYDESLPIEPAYQEKYEELVAD